jgi:hypothetical protein
MHSGRCPLNDVVRTGLSGSLQVTFSNPAEVAKTRLQLQGELAKGGFEKVYRNAFDVFGKTWRNEGIRGLQRGLGPAASDLQLCTLLAPSD